ncbi:ciliated left-right organizer metallopeptidase isoform X2 [Ascaphus truei]|uniref:ciliated left-right organizer metallopeptidase isoform X2 n=1 Tax=Ascaphus truei TaxID=8439 RepID=UPI003F5A9494
MSDCLFPLFLSLMTGLCLSACIHDSVQRDTLVVSPPGGTVSPRSTRISARSSPLTPLLPLRVTPWYLPGESALITPGQSAGLHSAMREVTETVSGILSVRRTDGPLLLSRDMNRFCRSVWRDPSLPNYNRCGSLDVSYRGETCLDVTIPPSHLRGFEVWPARGAEPSHMTPGGAGVSETDFLLYVRVAQTDKCAAQPSVIAYASFCQLDISGRPLAGVIVFCAERLRESEYQHSHIVQVSLHELLHALGFSSSLFERWTDCSLSEPGASCSPRSRVTNIDDRGQFRIYTPEVTRSLGEHLGGGGVGAPLENKDSPSSPSSHWEARLLQGSILTASLSPPHLTHVDPVTLAAFRDMGWYGVNTSIKGQLVWGRGAGSSFGVPSSCLDPSSGYFCTGSALGCHHLHLDKGVCSTDTYLEGCRVYKPLPRGGECWLQQNGGESEEIYLPQSRCFFSNLTKGVPPHPEVRGRCYLHRCLAPNSFQVRVQGSEWTNCPAGDWVQVTGFEGFLLCPSSRLCMGFRDPPPSPAASPPEPVSEGSLSPSGAGQGVRVQVTVPTGLGGSPEERLLLLDEVLGVIAQTAGVQRCFLHALPQMDVGDSFTLVFGGSPDCPALPSETSRHLVLFNLTRPGTPPMIYNSSNFSTVTIRFLAAESATPPRSGVTPNALVAGCLSCALLVVGLIGGLAWRRKRARSSRVGEIYGGQPDANGERGGV